VPCQGHAKLQIRLKSVPDKGVSAEQEHAYDQAKVDWLIQSCPTTVEVFEGLCKVYAERPMYGFCEPRSDKWQTLTYKQIHERVTSFAAGKWLSWCSTTPHSEN